ncbi:FAD/NAD(P)-binding oxidoreductase [Pyrofollis japonicus]|uniref:NAD(P)/FAD-dependent oxidoreductase n=1 Tax=Pyrofollis japonicus TaxID=3060460 RepID=UPI00295C3142|nr:FAD/NAD(P)-binding oxidoreductase [Pyrofollis japonicus]BEP18309.1 FAD/NAD(P)-binding oxidoreductase [Pyrofollis japonicus]
MPKKILVLGGGSGGVVAARKLALEARKHKDLDIEVTLVTNSEWHEFQPLYFDVALGAAVPDEVRAPIKNMEKFGVKVVIDTVKKIDAAKRTVTGEKGSYNYDYLIVSLGVKYGWDAYPGLAEAGVHNYTLDGALEMAKAMAAFKEGKIVVLVPESPHRCGMYPFEVSTQLAETFKKIGRKVEVTLVGPYPDIFPLGKDVTRPWKEKFEELGIEYIRHNGLQEVDPSRKIIRAGNIEERYDLLIKVPPSRLPDPLAESEGFQWKQDPRWAPVRARDFRHPDYDDVFLIGEHSMPPAGLPTAGVPIHFAADYVAEIVLNELLGGYPIMGYYTMMDCVGYFGLSGYAGTCETVFDESTEKWKLTCYTLMRSPIIRLMKEAFYKAWIASLK